MKMSISFIMIVFIGTKVMDATLDNTSNTQMISTNGLSTGIYVIKLESGQNQLTKKLIIK